MESKFSFKKRNIRSQASRKRKGSDDEQKSSSEDETTIVKKDRKDKGPNFMVQKTTSKSRFKASTSVADEAKSDEDEESVMVSYRSKRLTGPEGPSDMGATAVLEIETEVDKDAQAIFENSLRINKELKGKEDDKVYRGLNNYAIYYEKRDTAQGNASSGMVRKGPIRAPANLRSTVRWDYQPDICKDFKETGFCGFGDSCKFLHDRSDYKFGWQLEREMQDGTYGNADNDPHQYEIDSDSEDLPFKCFICRHTFKDPVVTKCKHYFCEKCALDQFKKSQRCFICNVQTHGVFNPAKEIIARMKLEDKGGPEPQPLGSDSDSD